jgi:hypothetical protein
MTALRVLSRGKTRRLFVAGTRLKAVRLKITTKAATACARRGTQKKPAAKPAIRALRLSSLEALLLATALADCMHPDIKAVPKSLAAKTTA